ncbi:MAG: efflux RND transporter periplasmic adaptor subunit [Yersiniaceae bacterium]|uniref:Efflux transporter periplasmic adaptor subunit n=1 Tax=Chimaeribacter coloradensis TaxID=2060068 RepID=A0A2N5E174_9GAMM|nr:efflux RND transporter periplasmic adaptor subunit [Chimaeribacter coloradensis]MDU6412428.1 efflux RND transporter periplasmic adaptor subunit [Yersiniaceae bacterium]PLR34092.1 efflux transporter periplasmic adaptor subunit [Chimaeribacter coloradensis]
MRRKLLSVSIVMLLSACDQSASSSAGASAQAQAPAVDVVTLHTQPVSLTTDLPGRTSAVRTAEVRPQVSGIIQKRYFTQGSEVKAGQPLYQIDPATYQAAYDKAQATLRNATALAKRYKPLAEAHAVSNQQYEDAVAAQKEAEADVKSARVNLDYTRITAPISGHIGRTLYTEGALVTNGQTNYLTTIQQLDPIYVDVSESSQDLLRQRRALASGQLAADGENAAKATLTLEDGTPYALPGRLEFSEVTVDEGTGSVTMRASFPNPHGELLPGMFVHATLQQGVQRQGILVPQEAIGHDIKGKPYVYLVKADSTVEQRTVETGEMIKGTWLVNSGLKEGDRVITNGLQSVRNGVKVTAHEQAGQADTDSTKNLALTDPSAQ